KFVEASGGTLFLDEVGELPPAAQVKLLRAIQEGQVDPVGARKPVKVDVRIISATNRNLIADVKNGRFREDLFYRLHVFPITVPPLRERPEDIPDLVRHFLVRFAAEEGKRIRAVAADALALLNAHPWPGNVRQLEELESEVIRFAIARYRGQMSEVARRLRIGRSTLYRKLDDLGLGGKSDAADENVASG